jgi:outer membrane protein OmpA-like peptidoglycan-associated protein
MKFYGWLLLSAYLVVFGCTVPEIDEVILTTQLQDAQQGINKASELEAESLVPEEYGRAVKLLNFARNSQEEGDIPQSAEFAYQAELVAQVAIAKARQHHARRQVVAIREQIYQQIIKAQEHEREIARIRQVITEKQLARALSSNDEGQQVRKQLSTEIADLKIALRQAELSLPLVNLESLISVAIYLYPAIEATADYERSQAATASIVNLIERRDFAEAEDAIAGAETTVKRLYELAVQRQRLEAEAKTKAQISIARAEVIIERAQYLNALQHAPEPFQEASTQLQRAKQRLTEDRYEQAYQFAERAQQIADEAVDIAEVIEFRERAQKELDRLISKAQRSVSTLQEKLAEQAKTQVPQLETRLYELANSAYAAAKAALAAKEYQTAITAAAEGSDYLERAIANTQQLTSIKSDLVEAAEQIPKVSSVIEQRKSVLVRINGDVFASGSTHLQESFFPAFSQLAEILQRRAFRDYPVRIESHTSSLGNASVNRKLSMARADAVMNYLVDRGSVDVRRLTAAGLGETEPIATDGTNKEAQNLRIDIIVTTN